MNTEIVSQKERFLQEVEQKLLRRDLDAKLLENGLLHVSWNEKPLCSVDRDGIVSSGSASATDEWAFIIWKQAQTSFRVRSSMTVPTWLSHRKSPAMWIGKRSSKAWIGSTSQASHLRFPNPQWSRSLSPSRKRRSGTSPFLATSTTARISRSTARRPVRSCGSLPSMSMWRLPTRKMYKSRLKSPSMSTSDSTSSTARNMCAWQ